MCSLNKQEYQMRFKSFIKIFKQGDIEFLLNKKKPDGVGLEDTS